MAKAHPAIQALVEALLMHAMLYATPKHWGEYRSMHSRSVEASQAYLGSCNGQLPHSDRAVLCCCDNIVLAWVDIHC